MAKRHNLARAGARQALLIAMPTSSQNKEMETTALA